MKFHWIETMDFHEKTSVVDSETLYLRAQMELEGVLGRKEYLLDLINALEPTGGAENVSKTIMRKKIPPLISDIGGLGERTFCGYTLIRYALGHVR